MPKRSFKLVGQADENQAEDEEDEESEEDEDDEEEEDEEDEEVEEVEEVEEYDDDDEEGVSDDEIEALDEEPSIGNKKLGSKFQNFILYSKFFIKIRNSFIGLTH